MSEDQMEVSDGVTSEQNKRKRSVVEEKDNARELLKIEKLLNQDHTRALETLLEEADEFCIDELNCELTEIAPSVADFNSMTEACLSIGKFDPFLNDFEPSATERINKFLESEAGLTVAKIDSVLNERGPSVAELDKIITRHPELLLATMDHEVSDSKPLHFACSFGHSYKIVELLVRRNPDVLHIPDGDGNLPIHLVVSSCVDENECFWFRAKEKALLLKLMVNMFPLSMQHKNNEGDTPLHLAFYAISQDCFPSELLPVIFKDHLPQILQTENKAGDTPLHLALDANLPQALFLAFFKDSFPQVLQIKNKAGETPFHVVCSRCEDLSLIKILYNAFPLAARWRNNAGLMPFCTFRMNRDSPLDILEFLGTECSPTACLIKSPCLDYRQKKMKPEMSAVLGRLERVSSEAVSALIDVAFHVKRILPDMLTKDIASKVASYLKTSDNRNGLTQLSLGQYSKLVLDESARSSLDAVAMLRSITGKNEDLNRYLKDEESDELHELLDNVVRMNRAGRVHFNKNPVDKVKGIKVLQAAGGLNALFFHLRENPTLSKHY